MYNIGGKSMRKILLMTALCFGLTGTAFAQALTNTDIIKLLEAGLGAEVLVAKIESSEETDFSTEIDDILSLKNQNVPDSVIAAMVTASSKVGEPVELSADSPDPMIPHYTGVYLMESWAVAPRMAKIDPISSTQTKTGGILGYAFTGGIASASLKAVIPGETARESSPLSRPVFYMYFDESNPNGQNTSAFTSGPAASVQSPNEFSLVELKRKKKRREARIGSFNIAGAKTGVLDKYQIPFSYEQLGRGIYKVTPDVDLEPGEYGFIFAVAGSGAAPGLAQAGTGSARVFAFSITKTK